MKNSIRNMLIVYVIMFVCIGLGFYGAIKDNEEYDIRNIDNEWNIKTSSQEFKNKNIAKFSMLNIKKGDVIVATKILDLEEPRITYPCVDIKTQNTCIDVYLDDIKIASNYKDKLIITKHRFLAELPENYNGKTLKIKCYVKEGAVGNVLDNIHIMSKNNYVYNQFRNNIMKYIIGAVVVSIGIILCIVALIVNGSTEMFKTLFWTGMIFLCSGVAMFAQFEILDMYITSSVIIKTVENISIYIGMISALRLVYGLFKKSRVKKIINVYSIVLLLSCLVTIYLNNMGMATHNNYSVLAIGYMYITILIIIVIGIKKYKETTGTKHFYLMGVNICSIVCLFTLTMSVVWQSDIWNVYGKYLCILCIVLFFIINIIVFASYLKEYLNKITEDTVLSTLAYTDHLTGLMNRTKYEKVIQSYGEKIKENITVVSFDLNNLKKINDNEGHEAGDIYIKTFADSLKKIFEDNKYLGRIGGDEFVVILDERINEIEKHIKALNVLFEMKMKNMECKFEASFAYGLANTKNDNNNNIKELIELADGRMYNNKQEQKKQKNASNLNNNKLKKTNKKV